MKIGFLTYGCKVNRYETELIKQAFAGKEAANGDADVYVINSCTVTGKIDSEIIRKIKSLKKKNKKVLLTGCVTKSKEAQQACGLADWVVDNEKKFIFSGYPSELSAKTESTGMLKGFTGRNKAFIKIEDGCGRFCSYCIIPFVRGSEIRSRDEDEILAEALALSRAGFSEIILTGINLGCYGAERGKNGALYGLLKKIAGLKTGVRFRLSSIGPSELTDDIIRLIADNPDKFCPHIHMSMQSGDEKVLKLMNRNYTAAEYRDKAQLALKRIDGLALTTDIIAGFPGEGEEEFNNTREAVEEIPFSRLHVFPFSPRPGTKAETMEGKIPKDVKKERVKELISLGRKKEREFIKNNKGKTRFVLVESGSGKGVLSGYTENYIKVNLKGAEEHINKLVKVKIGAIDNEGNSEAVIIK